MSGHFQPTYFDCRAQFRRLAEAQGATPTPYPLAARGVDGQDLTIDTAYLGPERAAQVLVLLSGTHGVEGFAGSACQAQYLAEDGAAARLPPDAAVLCIHAVNPFGFAWLRRANESNVDLNRNFLDHAATPVARPEYVAVDPIVNPAECSEATDAAFVEMAIGLMKERGPAHVQALLTNGQYECPKGIYYGGAQLEESNRLLRQIYQKHVAGAERVLMIDFHTGLGDSGEYTILTEHEAGSRSYQFLDRTFQSGRVETTVGGDSISAELHGEIGIGLAGGLPGVWFMASACEFGTVPGPQVIQALRHENWLFHHGDRDSAQGRAILQEILDAFRPDSDDWRDRILAGGREVIADACRGLFGLDGD